MKYLTDLGYSRGEAFYGAIDAIVETSKRNFDVEADHVFILVSSLRNGVEKPFVESILGQKISSNWEFLINRKQVNKFIEGYRNGIKNYSDSKKNVLFLASELHPNDTASDLLNEEIDSSDVLEHIEAYEWLSQVDELIATLKDLARTFR